MRLVFNVFASWPAGYLARRYTASDRTPVGEVVTSLNSSAARLTEAFCSVPSTLGISATSSRRTSVLSASLTDQLPKLAAKARAASPYSAAGVSKRVLPVSLNLGRPSFVVTATVAAISNIHGGEIAAVYEIAFAKAAQPPLVLKVYPDPFIGRCKRK
jgi:hypothetical protein